MASKVYTHAFATFGAPATTWFSFERDTLYISDESLKHFYRHYSPSWDIGTHVSGVEKLAIGQAQRPSRLSFRENEYGSLGSDHEALYCDIIGSFGNLKEVTFVALVGERYQIPLDMSNLIFMDYFDIYKEFDCYGQPYHLWREEPLFQHAYVFHTKEAGRLKEEIQRLRTEHELGLKYGVKFEVSDWKMPKIDRKFITSPETEDIYEETRKAWEEEKSLFKLRLSIFSDGIRPLIILMDDTTTIADVETKFRQERHIKPSTKFGIYRAWDEKVKRKIWTGTN